MRQPKQLASGLVVHLLFAVVFVWLAAGRSLSPAPSANRAPLVWTARPGQSGGGSGGDHAKASPAPLRRVVQAPQQFTLPQLPTVVSALELPGAVAVLSAAGATGPGTNDGGGKGEGGDGPGSGPRTGPGAGPGDGPFVDGTPGVTSPQVIYERRPEYTLDAMRARAQGTILIEATVLADGSVGGVRIVRSMPNSVGLDQKALEAVRAWRFRPGTYEGKVVAVKVLIELSFNLR
jgi:TonB family protein